MIRTVYVSIFVEWVTEVSQVSYTANAAAAKFVGFDAFCYVQFDMRYNIRTGVVSKSLLNKHLKNNVKKFSWNL